MDLLSDIVSKYNTLSIRRQALLKEVKRMEYEMHYLLWKYDNKINNSKKMITCYQNNLPIVINMFDINYLLAIPDDIFQQHIMQYLTFNDMAQLDNAIVNDSYRYQYFKKISHCCLLLNNNALNVFMIKNKSQLDWLYERKIFLKCMIFSSEMLFKKSEILKVNQIFQHCEDLTIDYMNKKDSDIISLIVSYCKELKHFKLNIDNMDNFSHHCKELQSLDLNSRNITDTNLIFLAKNCTDLKTLHLSYHHEKTNTGIIAIAQHCTHLKEISLRNCAISDVHLVAISEKCKGLETLDLTGSRQSITDVGIIQLSKHCTRLKSLNLNSCSEDITDASFLSISQHCKRLEVLNCYGSDIMDDGLVSIAMNCSYLQSLDITDCENITDDSIIIISKYCKRLHSLWLGGCTNLTDTSLHSLSQGCIGLKLLDISYNENFTDDGITAIAKCCIGLETIDLDDCKNITDVSVISIVQFCKQLKMLEVSGYDKITDASILFYEGRCSK